MTGALVLCVFSVSLLASCSLSEKSKRVQGRYIYTAKSALSNRVEQVNGTNLERPCHRHRKRVESFKHNRKFLPLCHANGTYAPLQCYPSSGYCWCVDHQGKEQRGTRTRGVISCGMKAVAKPCRRHRLRALQSRRLFATRRSLYLPRCDGEGYYSALQCLSKNTYCWCVDRQGKIKRGSRRKGIAFCEGNKLPRGPVDAFSANNRHNVDGPCFRHKKKRERLPVALRRIKFNPSCDEDGYYKSKQCHAGLCWCSNRDGKMTTGTKRKEDVDCETGKASGPTRKLCFSKRLRALRTPLFKKKFVPVCRPDGSYAPLQCDAHSGICWCVDERGFKVKGSKTKRTPTCFSKMVSRVAVRSCHLHRKYMKQLPSSSKSHIPKCKANGFFQPLQCSRDKDYCWCVKYDGTEIKGTVTFGIPQCPDEPMNLTDVFTANLPSRSRPCMRHKQKRKNLISLLRRNVFNPSCDRDGFYAPKQCHANYCWCSNRNGKILRGTRRKGDVDCNGMSSGPPLKPCLAARLKALKTSFFEKAFVPQCAADGFYTPLQCDVNNGMCWCVDKQGREITGSRTKRTPSCYAKVFNEIGKGPCNLLKSHVEKLPSTSVVPEPMCERNGFFQKSQCSKNRQYCWCVMPDGTEIEGSISFGKPRCYERRAPTMPKARGPCEEHLFQANNLASDREVFMPACDDKGFFATRQCNSDRGWCWCVDRYGSAIRGTRMKGIPNCDEKILKPCHNFKKNLQAKPGLQSESNMPVCTREGYFAPLQCNADTGKCWCVDTMGAEVPGTSIFHRPYCGKDKRLCELKRRRLLSNETYDRRMVVPSCDLHGYYTAIQCDHLKDECWCADRDGNEISETRTKGIPDCGQIPRPCDEHASRSSNYDYVFGVFIPHCDSQGYYTEIQCHKKTNVCWCSNKLGVEIPGSKTSGKPSCHSTGR